ncbi:hypothetical protein GCM10009624_35040 [Gordonia sinesedis]
MVPVTTRTPEQFGRIMLPGTTSSGRYAVVSSGGRILVDGADDVAWRAGIEDAVGHAPVSLDRVLAELHSRIADSTSGRPWVRSVRVADDLFCYLVADTDRQPPTFLPAWQSWCADREWVVSQQGRKIYALPRAVTKSAAVAEVRRRLIADGTLHPDDPVYAAGDGRLDIDLLEYADHAIRPRHGELDEIDYRRNHLTITESVGVLAGEEILRWFGARTTTATPRPIPTTVRTPS